MAFATAGGRRIEYEWIDGPGDAPAIVFLHEGLGSVAMWRDFPARLCAATHRRGLVYSRYGYGKSEALAQPRDPHFMHEEATVALPGLLDALDVDAPVLFGHSDGGSIALLHAALSQRPVSSVIAVAPHVFVEDVSIESIAKAKVAYETTNLRARLARHHDDPDSAFRGWNDIWLLPAFRDWNIEGCLPAIRCPILAIQGVDDEYGTMEQIDRIARGAVNTRVDLLKIPDCGHSPHRDQPERVIGAVVAFA